MRAQSLPVYALAVAVLLVVMDLPAMFASFTPSSTSAAAWTPPRRALGVVQQHHPVGALGYQRANGDCLTCGPRNVQRYPYDNWAGVAKSAVGVDGAGRLLVASARRKRLVLIRFDSGATKRQAHYSTDYGTGWRFGGTYFAPDGFLYVLLGRGNPGERDARVVLQVRKYSQTLVRRGTARYRSGHSPGGIFRPLMYSGDSFSQVGSELVVSFGRLMYADSGGVHHQRGDSILVDTDAMTASHLQAPSASHQFNGVARTSTDQSAYLAEHGDAYPRSIDFGVKPLGSGAASTFTLLKITGQTGDNFTGTTLNGLALGGGRALATGVSVPHRHAIGGVTGHDKRLIPNAYLISTALTAGDVRFHWLTTFDPASSRVIVGQPSLTPLGDGRFIVMFNVSRGRRLDYTDYYRAKNSMHYLLVDARGRVHASRIWKGKQYLPLSDPRLVGGRLFWVQLFRTETTSGRLRGGSFLAGLDVSDVSSPTILTR